MAFSDYQDFRLAVNKLIEGDDVSDSTFAPSTYDLMIGLGESRAYKDLRVSSMISPLALAPVSSEYTLPDDLLELKEIYFDAARPIEIVALDKLHRMGSLASNGNASYAAQNGEKLVFWPASTSGPLYGSYYARPEPMAETVDLPPAFFRYPEVFLYAALAESMPLIGFDSRLPLWQAKYEEAVSNAHKDELGRVYGGSRLRMRSR